MINENKYKVHRCKKKRERIYYVLFFEIQNE